MNENSDNLISSEDKKVNNKPMVNTNFNKLSLSTALNTNTTDSDSDMMMDIIDDKGNKRKIDEISHTIPDNKCSSIDIINDEQCFEDPPKKKMKHSTIDTITNSSNSNKKQISASSNLVSDKNPPTIKPMIKKRCPPKIIKNNHKRVKDNNSILFVDKYKPQNAKELIANTMHIKRLRAHLQNWFVFHMTSYITFRFQE